MSQILVTRRVFAEMVGVSASTITRATQGELAAALVGRRIDAASPAAIEYAESKGAALTLPPAAPDIEPSEPTAVQPIDTPRHLTEYLDLTLRDILARHRTGTGLLDFLRGAKLIEDIEEKRIKNAEREGDLVARALIDVGIIEPIDTMATKLLRDASRTIAQRAATMVGAGKDVPAIEKMVRDQLASHIKPAKATMARTLKNAVG